MPSDQIRPQAQVQPSLIVMMRFLILVSAAAALSTPASSSRSKSSSPVQQQQPKVWDDVLPAEEQRAALHLYASKVGLGHQCFSRPLAKESDRNIIERTLDAILTEIENSSSGDGDGDGDGSDAKSGNYVEYWTRQEWQHIEAHADVDESLSKEYDRGTLDGDIDLQSKYSTTYQGRHGHRYPIYGHVLYLQVGSDVRGPTCVFPGRSTGGDLLKPIMPDENSEEECADGLDGDVEERVQLVTVPAVAGRLLRFDGRDVHAVPRPTDLWMLPFVKGGAQYEPEEVWGRSVILFNVWPADEDPPLDIPLDKADGDLVESKTTESSHCNAFSNWNEMKAVQKGPSSKDSDYPDPNKPVKVWLLGNEPRRDYRMRTVPLRPPAEGGRDAVKEALSEKNQVTELWMRQ